VGPTVEHNQGRGHDENAPRSSLAEHLRLGAGLPSAARSRSDKILHADTRELTSRPHVIEAVLPRANRTCRQRWACARPVCTPDVRAHGHAAAHRPPAATDTTSLRGWHAHCSGHLVVNGYGISLERSVCTGISRNSLFVVSGSLAQAVVVIAALGGCSDRGSGETGTTGTTGSSSETGGETGVPTTEPVECTRPHRRHAEQADQHDRDQAPPAAQQRLRSIRRMDQHQLQRRPIRQPVQLRQLDRRPGKSVLGRYSGVNSTWTGSCAGNICKTGAAALYCIQQT
jgi:hypothetical protein